MSKVVALGWTLRLLGPAIQLGCIAILFQMSDATILGAPANELAYLGFLIGLGLALVGYQLCRLGARSQALGQRRSREADFRLNLDRGLDDAPSSPANDPDSEPSTRTAYPDDPAFEPRATQDPDGEAPRFGATRNDP